MSSPATFDSDPALTFGMNQEDELDSFIDARDLFMNPDEADSEMINQDRYQFGSASPSFTSHSSSSSFNHAASPQSSLNFNFNSSSSDMDEEIKTPAPDFSDPTNHYDPTAEMGNHSNQGQLSFDFDFINSSCPSTKYNHDNEPTSKPPQHHIDEQQQPDWSDPATLTNLWPSLFNDAISDSKSNLNVNPIIGNQDHDQWVFSAQLPIPTFSGMPTVIPSKVASSSSSMSSSSSSSCSLSDSGADQINSNSTSTPTSTHNTPSPHESLGPVEKKRKVSSGGAAPCSDAPAQSKSAAGKKGAATRANNNKRKQSKSTTHTEAKEETEEATPPPVSTRPLPQVDTSVSHSSLFVHPDVSGLSKRDARLVKNRAAAFLSRQRKREEFGELEKKSRALEGACRAIWKSLVKVREEAKGEAKSRVDELIKLYLDEEEKLKQEDDEQQEKDENVKPRGVREVLNEVVGGISLDHNQQRATEVVKKSAEEEKEKKLSPHGKGNQKGSKRNRDSSSLEAGPSASSCSPTSSSSSDELQALRLELNTSKIQNTALLQQLALERSRTQVSPATFPLPVSSNSIDVPQIKTETLGDISDGSPPSNSVEGMELDFDYNFSSGSFLTDHDQQLEPEFSYPPPTPILQDLNQSQADLPMSSSASANSVPSITNPKLSLMKKRSHNLSLAPAFSPSSIGNGPSSPFSLSIPGSPLLHSASSQAANTQDTGNGDGADQAHVDQKSKKAAGGMALMVILFSFALWSMPAGSRRDADMTRLSGRHGASSGQFDLGRVLTQNQFNNPSSSSKSKRSTPSSHLSPKDLHLSAEDQDDSSFSLLIPRNPTSEQSLPSCSITDVSQETARLLPVCRIETEQDSTNVITPVLSRSDSNANKGHKKGTSHSDASSSSPQGASSSRLALAYATDSNDYYVKSSSKTADSASRVWIEDDSWLSQALPSNLNINLSDLRSEMLDFSGWLSGFGGGSKKDDAPQISDSVYEEVGPNLSEREKILVREEVGNYLESRLETNRERGFILVGPPASSELSRRLGGNAKKSKVAASDEASAHGDQKVIEGEELGDRDNQQACPSIPTKLTLFVPAPKKFRSQECPVTRKPSGKRASSSPPGSGGLSGLATKALSLRPDSSITMSRDIGDGLKVSPSKAELEKQQGAQFSSSTEAILRALGLSQCPTLEQLQQEESGTDHHLHSSSGPMIDLGFAPDLETDGSHEDSFLELQFSLSTAKVRNKNQLADAVVGAIQQA